MNPDLYKEILSKHGDPVFDINDNIIYYKVEPSKLAFLVLTLFNSRRKNDKL